MDLNQIRKLDDAVNPTLSLFQPHVNIEQQDDIIGVFTVRFLSSGYQDFPALATHATHKSAASIVCVTNPEKSCRFSRGEFLKDAARKAVRAKTSRTY